MTDPVLGAQESICILDWWLSPELYLRRPPSKNEKYRLDAMLKAAADRGVVVNVIIYKEVQAALTLDSAVCKRDNSLQGRHIHNSLAYQEGLGIAALQHPCLPPSRPCPHRLRYQV